MTYTDIDQNFWLKTFPALASNLLLLAYALVKKPALYRYLALFAATTLLDICVAGHLVPIGNAAVQTAIEYLFVLVGDLRFIVLLAYLIYAGKNMAELKKFRPGGDVLRPALIFTLFTTLIISALGFARPDLFTAARHKFLAYEAVFFILTVLWIFVVLPQKPVAAAERQFLRSAAVPVLGFYGLWVLADLLILNGKPVGYAVRVLPNFLYYSLFLWWVAFAGRAAR